MVTNYVGDISIAQQRQYETENIQQTTTICERTHSGDALQPFTKPFIRFGVGKTGHNSERAICSRFSASQSVCGVLVLRKHHFTVTHHHSWPC